MQQLAIFGLFLVVMVVSYIIKQSTSKDFQSIDQTLEKVSQLCNQEAPPTKSEEA